MRLTCSRVRWGACVFSGVKQSGERSKKRTVKLDRRLLCQYTTISEIEDYMNMNILP